MSRFLRQIILYEAGYNPNEPRIGKGSQGGGRWTKSGIPLRNITPSLTTLLDPEIQQLHNDFNAQSKPLNPNDWGHDNWDYEKNYCCNVWHPNMNPEHMEIICPPTSQFNCISLAFNDTTKWWWPGGHHYWPSHVLDEESIDAFDDLLINHFRAKEANDDSYEEGYVKLSLFCDDDGTPTHMARLLPNGKWISKLGPQFGIMHELQEMEGGEYGHVEKIYKIEEEDFAKIREMQ